MKVVSGAVTLGKHIDGTPYILQAPVDGLESPDVRTSSFTYSGRDGGEVPEQSYGMRQITLQGTINSPNCDTHDADRAALRQEFSIRKNMAPQIHTFGGKTYVVYGKVIDFKMPVTGDNRSKFKIELLCGDPLIYDFSSGSSQSVTIYRKLSGGYVTPYDLPVNWLAGTAPANVVNSGEANIYPKITVTGIATNPVLSNLTTSQKVQVNVTMTSSDILVIDLKERTITLNGGSVIGLRSPDSSWWALSPGNNLLQLDSALGTDTVQAQVTWSPSVWGL